MEISSVVVPVLIMIFLGMLCNKFQIITRTGIENIKTIVTRIILPIAIFHALATAEYGRSTLFMVGAMLLMMIITFAAGYILKPVLKEPYKKYLPFMVSVYEGGMLAYPLYTNLCGNENLSKIAMLDIAGVLFGFSIYMGLLQQMQSEKKVEIRKLFIDALKNPAFLAAALGISVGISGIMEVFLNTGTGLVYLNCKDMITSPLNAMILLVVGYDLKPDLKRMLPCMKTIVLRFLVQGVAVLAILQATEMFFPGDIEMKLAVIIYMSVPTTFSMQSYMKEEEGSVYAATTNALYCLVTILVYILAAAIVPKI